MNRFIVPALLAWAFGGTIALADVSTQEVASRAWQITDAVLARHVEPPVRQAMILAGARTMALETRHALPPDLARRVSNLAGPEPLAALLDEILAAPKLADDPANPELVSIPDERTPAEIFLDGVLSAVPGGAELLPEKERKVRESMAANLYVGIQIQIGVDDKTKRPKFLKVLEGGPADNAGARLNDLIEEIDGASTEGMRLSQVVDRLRGAEGTEVLVRFRRPSSDEVFTKSMIRGTLPRATVEGVFPLPGKRWAVRLEGPAPIGYLKITEVSGSTPRELRAFAEQLESEGIKALVVDLRPTSSAGLHQAVLLADALLDGGVIGRVRTVDGEKTYSAQPDSLFRGWPIVVLEAGTRDAEVAWLCEALKDNERATILGEPNLPRDATVSEAVPLPGGDWSVKMATGRLERGDGRPLDRRGKGWPTNRVAAIDPETRALLERSNRLRAEGDRLLAGIDPKDLEAALQQFLSSDGKPDPTYSAAIAEIEKAKEQRRKLAANPGSTTKPEPAQDRDLTKAREILSDALKSTAK